MRRLMLRMLVICLIVTLPLNCLAETNINREPSERQLLEKDALRNVLHAVKENLVNLDFYSPHEVEALDISVRYYNVQKVWYVSVVENNYIRWKVLLNSGGAILHFVPYRETQAEDQTPSDLFWESTFEGNAYYEKKLYSELLTYSMAMSDCIEQTERWQPCLEKWCEENPSFLENPNNWCDYELIVLEDFGVPDALCLQQEEAIRVARDEAIRLGCSSHTIDSRLTGAYFFVTDPCRPVWEISFSGARSSQAENKESFYPDDMHYSSCYVRVEALTGDVLESYIIK